MWFLQHLQSTLAAAVLQMRAPSQKGHREQPIYTGNAVAAPAGYAAAAWPVGWIPDFSNVNGTLVHERLADIGTLADRGKILDSMMPQSSD